MLVYTSSIYVVSIIHTLLSFFVYTVLVCVSFTYNKCNFSPYIKDLADALKSPHHWLSLHITGQGRTSSYTCHIIRCPLSPCVLLAGVRKPHLSWILDVYTCIHIHTCIVNKLALVHRSTNFVSLCIVDCVSHCDISILLLLGSVSNH